jgi:hypothetical protein
MLRFDLQLTEPPPSFSPAGGGGGRKGGSAVREVEETLRMEQQWRTRRRLLKGFSGLARSWAVVTAASCRLANDRDLPEKKLERPLLHARARIIDRQRTNNVQYHTGQVVVARARCSAALT